MQSPVVAIGVLRWVLVLMPLGMQRIGGQTTGSANARKIPQEARVRGGHNVKREDKVRGGQAASLS